MLLDPFARANRVRDGLGDLTPQERIGCFFISAPIAAALTAVGVGATTAATIAAVAAPAIIGAGVGALGSAVTGGNPGMGALFGGALGGLGGAAGQIFGGVGTGAGATATDAAGNAISPAAAESLGGVNGGADALATSPDAAGFAAASSGVTPADYAASLGSQAVDPVTAAQALGATADAGSGGGSSSGIGSILSKIFGARGNQAKASGAAASGISGTDLALGALAAGAGILGRPNPNTPPNYGILPNANTVSQGPLFNQPLQTSGYLNRTPVMGYTPSTGSWYTYGNAPEPQYFANNQLHFAHGGALNRARAANDEFSTERGDHYVDTASMGQDDDEPARLSGGEWVADANFVSALGDGNNAAGSKVLYALRHAVMRDKGMKHDVPPKLKKSPLGYLAEARRTAGVGR